MNKINEIFRKIFQYANNLYDDAKSHPFFKRYVVLTCILTTVFTLILFPVDTIILKVLRDAEGKSFQSAEVSNLKASLFGDISIDSLKINLRSREAQKQVFLQAAV